MLKPKLQNPQAKYLATIALVSKKRKLIPMIFGPGTKRELSWDDLERLFLEKVCTCTMILPVCHFLVAKDLEMLAPAASALSLADESIPKIMRIAAEPEMDGDVFLGKFENGETTINTDRA